MMPIPQISMPRRDNQRSSLEYKNHLQKTLGVSGPGSQRQRALPTTTYEKNKIDSCMYFCVNALQTLFFSHTHIHTHLQERSKNASSPGLDFDRYRVEPRLILASQKAAVTRQIPSANRTLGVQSVPIVQDEGGVRHERWHALSCRQSAKGDGHPWRGTVGGEEGCAHGLACRIMRLSTSPYCSGVRPIGVRRGICNCSRTIKRESSLLACIVVAP